MARNRSGAAVGFTMFAAFMMILIGSFHIIAGLAGILEDEFYAVTPNWVLQFDATTWGWIHLLAGIIVLLAGFALFSGAVWARTVGVIMVGEARPLQGLMHRYQIMLVSPHQLFHIDSAEQQR